MNYKVVLAKNTSEWLDILSIFEMVNPCRLPEYHLAYQSLSSDAQAVLWYIEDGISKFCYPFILSPVSSRNFPLDGQMSCYKDISSVYGYGGPLLCNGTKEFLNAAWSKFDHWANSNHIIAEFTRFCPFEHNQDWAHRDMKIEKNRLVALSHLPENSESLFKILGPKTRNMIRKAEKNRLIAKELDVFQWLGKFRLMYMDSMRENMATSFFNYDDEYFDSLCQLPSELLKLYGVFAGEELVATAMVIIHQKMALYHLGASKKEYARLGAGNLALWKASTILIEQGIQYFNLGGGRTTDDNDFLLKFKKSNATSINNYYIGKRIINTNAYEQVLNEWIKQKADSPDLAKVLFYR